MTMDHEFFGTSGQCGCAACSGVFVADAPAAATQSSGGTAPAFSGSASYIDALVNEYDFKWGGTAPGVGATVTYSFLTSAPRYYSASTAEQSTFAQATAAQQEAVRAVLQMYAAVANLDFVEISGVGSIAIGTADLGAGIAGWAYYPDPDFSGPSDNGAAGDVWITRRYESYGTPVVGAATYAAIVHEIGHALGLKHPGNYNAVGGGTGGPYLPAGEDSQKYTVMSYYGGPNGSAAPITAQLYDIAALQYLYGANMSTRTGDDIYNFSTTVQVKTIWDAGGNDVFDASNQLAAVSIDLHEGAFSSIAGIDNVAIAFDVTIEGAVGSNYNDTLRAGRAGATLRGGLGNDTLIGDAGADVLIGGVGSDTLTGGGGADRFVFDSLSINGQDADLVHDLSTAEGDVIDLSWLLSVQYLNGSGQTAGELVRAIEDDSGLVLLQIDPDGTADSATWQTLAKLVGVSAGSSLNVVLDTNLAAATITVAPAAPPALPTPTDLVRGTDGDDTIHAAPGVRIVIAGAGNDKVSGANGVDSILVGGTGDDMVGGGDGDDMLAGDDGNDIINGGIGDDTVFGGAGDDQVGGGPGNDIVVGDAGNDSVWGEAGDDLVNGGDGDDILLGGDGNDQFGGGSGHDIVQGEAGNDTIWGEDGDDLMVGGTGDDIIVGGADDDTFVFEAGDGNDVITDFVAGGNEDRIWFAGTDLHSFADVLSHATFDSGTGATTISYDGGTLVLNGVALKDLVADDFLFT